MAISEWQIANRLIPFTPFTLSPLQHLKRITPIILITLTGLIAYYPTLTLNFFWEDPFDIGQVDSYSYVQLLTAPNSNSYYRPLALIILKALKLGANYSAFPYHLFNVTFHLLAAALLYGLANHLFKNRVVAFSGGVLFVLYPIGYEAPARASSMHSLYVCLTLVALWSYSIARQTDSRRHYTLTFLCAALFPPLHENGIMLPPLIIVLEIYLLWQHKLKRSFIALIYFIPALIFLIIWFSIPKSGEAPAIGVRGFEALYLSQGIAFPIARLMSQLNGFGLTAITQALMAAATAALFLFLTRTRQSLPPLVLALIWWGVAMSLAWIARPIEYLEVSPRVMYFPSWAASLAWGMILLDKEKWRRAVGGVTVVLVILQSWTTLQHSTQLYLNGSRWIDQVIGVGKEGGRLLFVNAPDRFMYREQLYPLGYWGMLVAPVSQDLSDFVRFTTGVKMETKSLSDFQLMKPMMDASPYFVNTRGSANAHASDVMYDSILWADKVMWTDYGRDGSLTIKYVGDVRSTPLTSTLLGRVGDVAQVTGASVMRDGNSLRVTLLWRSLNAAKPTDTIFVHVLDSSGALVGQGDGESLNGLLPSSAWRAGHEIEDVRAIIFDAPLIVGEYRLTVGMYDRADGKRYKAFDAKGVEVSDGELEVGRVEVR